MPGNTSGVRGACTTHRSNINGRGPAQLQVGSWVHGSLPLCTCVRCVRGGGGRANQWTSTAGSWVHGSLQSTPMCVRCTREPVNNHAPLKVTTSMAKNKNPRVFWKLSTSRPMNRDPSMRPIITSCRGTRKTAHRPVHANAQRPGAGAGGKARANTAKASTVPPLRDAKDSRAQLRS